MRRNSLQAQKANLPPPLRKLLLAQQQARAVKVVHRAKQPLHGPKVIAAAPSRARRLLDRKTINVVVTVVIQVRDPVVQLLIAVTPVRDPAVQLSALPVATSAQVRIAIVVVSDLPVVVANAQAAVVAPVAASNEVDINVVRSREVLRAVIVPNPLIKNLPMIKI